MILDCGLFFVTIEESSRPNPWSYVVERMVPLQSVHVEACVVETTAEVKIVQRYFNPNSYVIDAKYVFPLDERAAVCEFEAEINGKKVIGVAKEKEEAQMEYNQAVARGDGAYLLEEAKPDIFEAKIGNIPAQTEVSIIIKYVAEIKCELDKIRFVLPTKIAPRYTPIYTPTSQVAPAGSKTSAVLSVSLTCVSISGFDTIESPSHSISVNISGPTASIGLDRGISALEKDFVVLVSYAKPHEPKVVLEEHSNGTYAAMVTLFPHLEFADAKSELIFVVDRSGSMEPKVAELREAMNLFIRSLPANCYFNIIGFGSSFSPLLPTSAGYSNETLKIALNHISSLSADLGGTELLQPLKYAFSQPLIPGYSRQVFVLTDGEISNTEMVLKLVQENTKNARLFSLGIGNNVSHHLVEGLARAGKGTSAFALEGERIEKKILKQLKDAIQPALNDVKVNWNVGTTSAAVNPSPVGGKVLSLLNYVSPAASEKPVTLHQAPFKVPPIFSDSHFRIYSIFSAPKLPAAITIEAMSPDGLLKVELPVNAEKLIKGNLIHTLAARALIRDLEEGTSSFHAQGSSSPQLIKNEIVRLGTTYGLASKHTSFIAIEERDVLQKFFQTKPKPQPNTLDLNLQLNLSMQNAILTRGDRLDMLVAKSEDLSAQSNVFMKKSSKMSSWGFSNPFSNLFSSSSTSASASTSSSSSNRSWSPFASQSPAPAPAQQSFAPPSASYGAAASFGAPPPPPPTASYGAPPPPPGFGAPCPPPAPSIPYSALSEVRQMAMDFEYEKEEEEKLSSFGDPFSAPPQLDSRTTLSQILNHQDAQGFFYLNPQLTALLGIDLHTLEAPLLTDATLQKVADPGLRRLIWITLVVLVFFRKRLADLEEDWEMVEMKAKRWLASNANLFPQSDLEAVRNAAFLLF